MKCERCFKEIHAEEEIWDHFHGWDSAQLSGPLFAEHPSWSGKITGTDGPKAPEGPQKEELKP